MSKREQPTLRYTRRRDRVLAFLWPPKRRKLRAQQHLLDYWERNA